MRRYPDRRVTGQVLLEALRPHLRETPVVLALPRGGVPVAFEIATALKAPLDLILVRKIGAPGREEFSVGAVVDGETPYSIADQAALDFLQLSPEWFDLAMAIQLEEIRRRRHIYLRDRKPIPLTGREVVVVDDGVATGNTARVALKAVADSDPARLLFAAPVGAATPLEELRPLVDECICPYVPRPFEAVGQHYDDFTQTTDAEVIALLKQAMHV